MNCSAMFDRAKRCFACDRKLGKNPYLVDTRDAQTVYVGSECYKLIRVAGEAGYQPPAGGPRLFLLPRGMSNMELDAAHAGARRR